jgi:hypothetical protein
VLPAAARHEIRRLKRPAERESSGFRGSGLASLERSIRNFAYGVEAPLEDCRGTPADSDISRPKHFKRRDCGADQVAQLL